MTAACICGALNQWFDVTLLPAISNHRTPHMECGTCAVSMLHGLEQNLSSTFDVEQGQVALCHQPGCTCENMSRSARPGQWLMVLIWYINV